MIIQCPNLNSYPMYHDHAPVVPQNKTQASAQKRPRVNVVSYWDKALNVLYSLQMNCAIKLELVFTEFNKILMKGRGQYNAFPVKAFSILIIT